MQRRDATRSRDGHQRAWTAKSATRFRIGHVMTDDEGLFDVHDRTRERKLTVS